MVSFKLKWLFSLDFPQIIKDLPPTLTRIQLQTTKEELPKTDLSKTCDDVFQRDTPSPITADFHDLLMDTVSIFMISDLGISLLTGNLIHALGSVMLNCIVMTHDNEQ